MGAPSKRKARHPLKLTSLQPTTMQTLKGFEQHSFSSLASRLDYLVSRQTLSNWVENGTLRPAKITRNAKNTHLLFSTSKLNQLHRLLKKSQIFHAAKLPCSGRQSLAQRLEAGRRNAAIVGRLIEKRRLEGKPHGRAPNPATNPDDAVGRIHLTFDPKADKNLIRVFGGYGCWKK